MNTDKEFWKKLKQGDSVALGAIYERYSDMLYAYGMKIAQNSELINDCIQDLFVYLYDKRETITVPKCVKAYLLISLKRRIYTTLMGLTEEKSQTVNIDNLYADGRSHFNLEIDVHATMEQHDFTEDQLNALQKALENLSPREREFIYLRYYKQLSLDEVVEISGTSKQCVKNITSRGLARLRENELLTQTFLLELVVFHEIWVNAVK